MKLNQRTISGQNDKCQFQFEIGWTCFQGQAPYFSITGETWELGKPRKERYSNGCGALTLGDYVPELAHLDKYHLVSTEQPMHYIANALYHASNRDHNGLLKGEKRQIKNGKTGQPAWHLVAVNRETGEEVELYTLDKTTNSVEQPYCKYTLEYRPWCIIGEGKEPDLQAARNSACWPDAELWDFTKEKLEARLPELMKQFKQDVEAAGIKWPETEVTNAET